MAIEDEKTRPALRAVKRKPAASVADVPTRAVMAVKRGAALPEQRLVAPYRVLVLPRGELINGAGEPDNGWVVRDDEGTECLRFVLTQEGLGATVLRALAGGKYFMDTMDGAQVRGGLVLDRVEGFDDDLAPQEGAGHLFDAEGGRRAGFVVRANYEVICLDAASKVVFESKPTEDGARVLARKRTVATVVSLKADGLLVSRHGGLELTFEKSATPFERLALVAGMTLCEAWLLERRVGPRSNRGRRGLNIDLGKLLFGGD